MIDLRYYDERHYILMSKLTAETEKYTKFYITVLPGLLTDGASIPKPLWSIIGSPLTGRYVRGAIVHDGLYNAQITSRKEADKVFLELMEQDKVPKWKRYLIYWGVRIGGGFVWRSKPKKKIEKVREFIFVTKKEDGKV